MAEPLERLPDCIDTVYALQLNTYRFILESEYGMSVSAMYLVCLHPQQPWPYVYQVPRMEYELRTLVALASQRYGVSTDNYAGEDAAFVVG